MYLPTLGKSVESNHTEDIYYDVFKMNSIQIVLIIFSTLAAILIVFPLNAAFIWYDYFGPHSERVILNRLISSMCETDIAYLIFVQSIDTSRYLFGPFSGKTVIIL